jgi:hypothetical protein
METHFDGVINREARVRWTSAALAGLITGAVVWLLSHGVPWFTSGLVSPTLMGRDLKRPGVIDPTTSLTTVLAQILVSVCYACIIAPLITRFRGMWAVGIGALAGLVLYAINFAIFHLLTGADWNAGREITVMVTHFVYGAIVAGLYKGLARPKVAA